MTAPPALGAPHRVEVMVPDEACAALLLEYASPAFPAELVVGVPLLVRLQPPEREPRWVTDFLALIQRWLESAPLPCAKVVYGGRSYLIRLPMDVRHFVVSDSGSAVTS